MREVNLADKLVYFLYGFISSTLSTLTRAYDAHRFSDLGKFGHSNNKIETHCVGQDNTVGDTMRYTCGSPKYMADTVVQRHIDMSQRCPRQERSREHLSSGFQIFTRFVPTWQRRVHSLHSELSSSRRDRVARDRIECLDAVGQSIDARRSCHLRREVECEYWIVNRELRRHFGICDGNFAC